MSREQRKEVENLIVEGLNAAEVPELAGSYFSLETMSEEQRAQLVEDHFLFKEGDRFLEAAGLNRDWPEGRGIYHNESKTFLVWINEEDQLRIISMEEGYNFIGVYARLTRAANSIEKIAAFARDDRLGYLTSCPTNLGTGLRISVHVELPFLGAEMEQL